jgi:predicted Rossmann fold nucleotide-binding protein DprA/Smf involved in DNA uptake
MSGGNFLMSIATVVGKRIDFSDRSRFIAIIGTTKPTEAERQAAFDLGRESVLNGLIVVSGLAEGLDTAAHEGALSVDGDFAKTVAILSTSPHESVYPNSNYQLAERIKLNGAVVHCYKTKAPWTNERFGPKVKRLVERDVMQAYLSSAVYAVSEAKPITGGTRWAINYGKHLGLPTFRYGVDRKSYADFDYKVESGLIRWKMELDWNAAGEELVAGNYDFWEVK